MKTRLLIVLLLLVLSGVAAWGNGDPAAWIGEGGALVPISRPDIGIDEERLTIEFPALTNRDWRAIIRAEYDLRKTSSLASSAPLEIGFPISFPFMTSPEYAKTPLVYVKLDGKAIRARYLTFEDLIAPTINLWIKKIDKLLKDKHDLHEAVVASRNTKSDPNIARLLAGWMCENMDMKGKTVDEMTPIAEGLIGGSSGKGRDYAVQAALKWLDPNYQEVDLFKQLSQRWDHEPLLLDPQSKQLAKVPDERAFGVFQFQLPALSEGKHKLVVQYRQRLGFGPGPVYKSPKRNLYSTPFQGIRYILTPAKKWASWGTTHIKIVVPQGWQEIAIRPAPNKTTDKQGMKIHEIVMGKPEENLYVSALRKPEKGSKFVSRKPPEY
jgi:hypothetical protein